MKKASSPKFTPKTVNPADLEEILIFHQQFPRRANSLFADSSSRLFVAVADEAGKGVTIERGGYFVPIKEALPSDFREIGLKEALEWYVECAPWSDGFSGSVELLCKLAAKKLKG